MTSSLKILTIRRNCSVRTKILSTNSSRTWKNQRTRASSLKIISLRRKSRRLRSWLRLCRRRDRSSCGSEKFSWKRRCKMPSTPLLGRLKLWLWEKKSTECSWDTTHCARDKRKWLKTWSAPFLSAKRFNLSTCRRLKRKTLRTAVSN